MRSEMPIIRWNALCERAYQSYWEQIVDILYVGPSPYKNL